MVQSRAGSGNTVGIMVRMPEDLRDRVKAVAEEGGRSMNSEIVATLEVAYPPPEHTPEEIAMMYQRAVDEVEAMPPSKAREQALLRLKFEYFGVAAQLLEHALEIEKNEEQALKEIMDLQKRLEELGYPHPKPPSPTKK